MFSASHIHRLEPTRSGCPKPITRTPAQSVIAGSRLVKSLQQDSSPQMPLGKIRFPGSCRLSGLRVQLEMQLCPTPKTETATVEILGKIMDQLARQIGAMNPEGPKRKVLIDEISELSHIRAWLRSETTKQILEKADELARGLALLK